MTSGQLMPVFRSFGVLVHRCFGSPVLRCSGAPVFWCSVVPVLQTVPFCSYSTSVRLSLNRHVCLLPQPATVETQGRSFKPLTCPLLQFPLCTYFFTGKSVTRSKGFVSGCTRRCKGWKPLKPGRSFCVLGSVQLQRLWTEAGETLKLSLHVTGSRAIETKRVVTRFDVAAPVITWLM